MIEVALQLTQDRRTLIPCTPEDMEKLKAYIPNQVLRAKITGNKRPRSVEQHRWIFGIFQIVASNSGDDGWNTVDKVKRNVKMMMQFFSERFVVGDQVYFELKSFAFDQMPQEEANQVYEKAKEICAWKLGVDPNILEANAKNLPF